VGNNVFGIKNSKFVKKRHAKMLLFNIKPIKNVGNFYQHAQINKIKMVVLIIFVRIFKVVTYVYLICTNNLVFIKIISVALKNAY
jgi:phage tail sheath protein FI